MQIIRVPDMGEIVTHCQVVNWLCREGEAVAAGAPLAEIVADKAVFVVESPCEGLLLKACAPLGSVVPAGGILAVVAASGEALPPEANVTYPSADDGFCLRFRAGMDGREPVAKPEVLSPMRRIIAARMAASKGDNPHFYVTTAVDMSACGELRQRLKKEGVRVSFNDMLIKAAGLALRQYPRCAALYTGEGYAIRNRMDVGFAVAVGEDGLVVPVIRAVDSLPLAEVAKEAKRLAELARDRKLLPPDFCGGVFTVSNLGTFQVESFSAIINPGESAILAVGQAVDTPVVVKGEVVVRPIMRMTLSSDHRVIDGVLAARFNGYVKDLLEKPERLLSE